MNEYKYAENLANKSNFTLEDLGTKPSATLGILAKYYRMQDKSDDEITQLLKEFVKKCLGKDFQESKWVESITYQVKKSKSNKYSLRQVDKVYITKSELNTIQKVESKVKQKVLFALLVVAKYYNLVSDKNNNWTNLEMKQIFKIANVQLTIQNQALLIHELYKDGYIKLNKKVGSPNIAVNIIDNNSEVVLEITRLKDAGKEYLMYCGENYVRCKRCGDIFRKTVNNNKYCKKCQGYQPIKTKLITCVDCGKEFEINPLSRQIRCNNCHHKERQRIHRANMQKNRK